MDARYRRSREALVAAVIELAEQRDIDGLTVTDVAASAGISRDTFYRHAHDPIDLLTGALWEELESDLAEHLSMPVTLGEGQESVFSAPARIVAAHLRTYRPIYIQSRVSHSGPRLTEVVYNACRAVIGSHLANHPEIAPAVLLPLDEPTADIAISYASAGASAAFMAWLVTGDLDDVHRAAELVLASGPAWWLGLTPAAPAV